VLINLSRKTNMTKSIFLKSVPLLAVGVLLSGQAFAAPVPSTNVGVACNPSHVQVTWVQQISPVDTGRVDIDPRSAIACAGVYSGNDASDPQTNLGYAGDGWANGESSPANSVDFDPGLFIGEYGLELQDLNPDTLGQTLDPGWIMVGKHEGGQFNPQSVGNDADNPVVLDDTFACTNCDSPSTSGTWELTPDADLPGRFTDAAGTTKNAFDAFALILKGGNYYSVYLFTAAQFGITDLTTVNQFGGTWTMPTITSTLNNGKLKSQQPANSHLSVWAHDPASSTITEVPEPGMLGLFGLGLIALGAVRRQARQAV
jgi:hypothetical protein